MEEKTIRKVIFILIIFQILFCFYLAYNYYTNSGVCNGGSCGTVQNSEYGNIFGISLNYIGVFAFVLLFLGYRHNPTVFTFGAMIGTLSAIALISIQFFVLKEVCSYCMVTDTVMITIGILTLSVKEYRQCLTLKGVVSRVLTWK